MRDDFLLWRRKLKLRPRAAGRLQSYDAAGSARVVSMLTLSPVDVCCSSRFTSCTLQLRLRRSRRRRIVYRSRRAKAQHCLLQLHITHMLAQPPRACVLRAR